MSDYDIALEHLHELEQRRDNIEDLLASVGNEIERVNDALRNMRFEAFKARFGWGDKNDAIKVSPEWNSKRSHDMQMVANTEWYVYDVDAPDVPDNEFSVSVTRSTGGDFSYYVDKLALADAHILRAYWVSSQGE